ncbi:unnamed protein product [Trichogramma brassicae]|uniref:Uncharacterized protein n=1 Tax=Trichogramma brassicae TaxID=86971 RepID=A0A6H5IT16_9HYME|nr:unnamed protein product [Trichogramma brassicae]
MKLKTRIAISWLVILKCPLLPLNPKKKFKNIMFKEIRIKFEKSNSNYKTLKIQEGWIKKAEIFRIFILNVLFKSFILDAFDNISKLIEHDSPYRFLDNALHTLPTDLGSRGAPASVPTEVSCNKYNCVIGSWLHETHLASHRTRYQNH